MKRSADSIASSFDFSSKTAYPPMTSLASVKGPSIVVTCPRESRTRVLIAVGASPPLANLEHFVVRSGAALSPFNRLLLRFHLNHPIATEYLFRFRKWSVGHLGLPSGERDARPHRGWVQAVERQ